MTRRKLELAGALGHLAADKRLEVLRRVGEGGSISQAARDSGISYKAAWQALDTLSNLAGMPLVARSVGGAGGGGARLTPAGQRLLEAAAEMMRAREQVLSRMAVRSDLPAGLAGLALRTSMRNQLPVVVQALEQAGSLVRLTLEVSEGLRLRSLITAESAQLLGLRCGLSVVALWKATTGAVLPVAAVAHVAPSVNQMPGRVARVARGTLGDEVVVQLAGGAQLVGIASCGSGLRAGRRVVLQVDEGAVVIALG